MPRKPQLMTDRYPYHVTARSNNREWFFLPLQDVWSVALSLLARVKELYSVEVISFVLMSNHFHLFLHAPLANLDKMMNYFQREVSREICRQAGRINHIFGGRYKSSLICDEWYFFHTYKYVYRNPVQAEIIDKVECYPFSSLNWLLQRQSPFPLMDIFHPLSAKIPLELADRLTWLNTPYTQEQQNLIKNALRRLKCQFTTDRNKRREVLALLN